MPVRTRKRTATVTTPRKRKASPAEGETLGDLLIKHLENAAAYTKGDQISPCAILWPDPERRWQSVIATLRDGMPALHVLGAWQPEDRTGPAIWLRCVEGRVLEQKLPDEATPIFYLPGVSSEMLRQTSECPPALAPLVELQFRGAIWNEENGRDWTPTSWISSIDGVQVDASPQTAEAIQRALPSLLKEAIANVRRIDAEFCHELVAPDMPAQLLRWMSDPGNARARFGVDGWQAFREQCRAHYSFDPERDGELKAAELLSSRHAAWAQVWERFKEAPRTYTGVVTLLRKLQPQLSDTNETSPLLNERAEEEVAAELGNLANRTPAEAITAINELAARHASRRNLVWRQLGEAQLAVALEPLSRLAQAASHPVTGSTVSEIGQRYAEEGWQVDGAAIDALRACTSQRHEAPVAQALRAIYQPWLDQTARTLQMFFRNEGAMPRRRLPPPSLGTGRCVLFADGLRMDIARRLEKELKDRNMAVAFDWDWAPLPPVTPSAKPYASPIAELFVGGEAGDEFAVTIKANGQRLTQPRFVDLLGDGGWQVLESRAGGNPSGGAWTECGSLDKDGHNKGWRLALAIDSEVRALADRVQALISSGWREVVVLTDHGWLLLPDGLPKTELKSFLAVTRWGRCATLTETATPDLPLATWAWNRNVTLAFPPGIGCFKAGTEYSHGGISPQELVIPRLTIQASTASAQATIVSVKWTQARCNVVIDAATAGYSVDLRQRAADPSTSFLPSKSPKPVAGDGTATVFLAEPTDIGTAALLVLLDSNGTAIQTRPVTLGENA